MTSAGAQMDERVRRRTVGILFGGVALATTGYIAAITVATLAGDELGGAASWAGVPSAAAVLGTAAGAALLAWLSGRQGRRLPLAVGHLAGAGGSLVAVGALMVGSLPLLLLGMFIIGLPNAAAQVARYAGGDMYPAGRRARAIGIVVWGATVGAVVGPNLIGPTGSITGGLGMPVLAGGLLMAAVSFGVAGIASFALLRPDPAELADRSRGASIEPEDHHPRGPTLRESLAQPNVGVAVMALIAGQLVMVMVMTMTPVHLRDHGHDLAVVGLVMSAHTVGMFALAPISGRLTARYGSLPVILVGFGLLALASVLAALAPPAGGPALLVALFLLGFGWNLGFVAGSSLLSGGLSLAGRARLQGTVDAAVWSTSAISSLLAGPLLDVIGYSGLGLLAAALTSVPALVVALRRSSPTAQTA